MYVTSVNYFVVYLLTFPLLFMCVFLFLNLCSLWALCVFSVDPSCILCVVGSSGNLFRILLNEDIYSHMWYNFRVTQCNLLRKVQTLVTFLILISLFFFGFRPHRSFLNSLLPTHLCLLTSNAYSCWCFLFYPALARPSNLASLLDVALQ